jgi:hypothetical protein
MTLILARSSIQHDSGGDDVQRLLFVVLPCRPLSLPARTRPCSRVRVTRGKVNLASCEQINQR